MQVRRPATRGLELIVVALITVTALAVGIADAIEPGDGLLAERPADDRDGLPAASR